MDEQERDSGEEIIINVHTTKTEGYVDDLPSAEESGLNPALVSTGEPEPFDPSSSLDAAVSSEIVSGAIEINDELDAAAEAATAKEETPTPESIAAELKEVAEHAAPIEEEPEEEPVAITAPVPDVTPKKKSIIPAIIIIALITVAAVIAGLFFMNQSANDSNDETDASAVDNTPKNKTYDYVAGAWESQAEGGSCYVFLDDEKFYWLRDSEDFNDNYYYGNVASVLRGQKALKAIGTSLSSVKQMVHIEDKAISEDDIFLLNLQATERKIGGVDTSSALGTDFIKLLFIRSGSSTKAYGYQFNSGDMYEFAKNSEVVAPTRKN